MIDPDVPPPLPPQVVPQTVYRGDGTPAQVVTLLDAARLADVTIGTINDWILKGKVAMCYTPDRERRVFVESLWRALPLELRR